MQPSQEQEAIFDWFANGSGHAVVFARAGTGKTTTILEGVRRAWEPRALVCAFNKKIADELTRRLGNAAGRIEAKTLHSIGFGFVRRRVDGVQIDQHRGKNIAQEVCPPAAPNDYVRLVYELAALGKSTDHKATVEDLIRIAVQRDKEPDLQLEAAGYTTESAAVHAYHCMQAALVIDEHQPSIDFDDMLYIPMALGWTFPRFDLLVVDEAQDMNPVQLELAMRVARGRICAVGDDRQAIYGFRGADTGALANIKRQLGAKEFGLTTTYRCGKAIVAYAQRLVPDFKAHEANPDGQIVSMDKVGALDVAAPGDFILSRKNAPLVGLCLSLLQMGKPARIEGRDIGATLASVVRKQKADTVETLKVKLGQWHVKECQRARRLDEKSADQKIETLTDQLRTLTTLAADCDTVDELLETIAKLFSDSTGGPERHVVLSSIHKSKGLEADRVFVLRDTLYPGKDGRERIEEANLDYVAATRAKKTLVWLNGVS